MTNILNKDRINKARKLSNIEKKIRRYRGLLQRSAKVITNLDEAFKIGLDIVDSDNPEVTILFDGIPVCVLEHKQITTITRLSHELENAFPRQSTPTSRQK